MLYKGIEVEEICPVVYIKDKATKDWKENERYVLNKMVALGFSEFGVENPIDDLVHVQFDNKDWAVETELLGEIYKKLKTVFEEVKINLYLDGYIEEIGNTVDLTLEEFINLPK